MKRTNKYLSRIRFFSAFLLTSVLAFCFYSTILADEIRIYEADVKEVPLYINFNNIQKIVSFKECLYVLDSRNHRIVAIKDNKPLKQIGMIGNKKGELYYPSSLFIDGNSFFYVLDRGNRRVQIMDSKGNYKGDIPERPLAFGMAVDSKGLILLSQPKLKKLITVYDIKGKRLAQFGELLNPSEIYGDAYKKYDNDYKLSMNRIYLTIGEKDDIWVVFYHMPLICRYDNEGNLVYKKIIDIEGIDKLKEAVWNTSSHPEYLSLGMDGFTLTMVINDIVYEGKSKKVYVLLGDNQILVLNSKTNEKYVIKPRIIKGAIERIGVTYKGEIYLSFFFSSKLYRLVFRNQM
ncbi:MAG: hypothetical protein JSV88_08910 [Candidatus Aminicenantes bacterium]|nr:MAG: hypothetical protein JSV88_08910 [Candidatus Aminicenantes bacterium]